jgi:hypothetical protein
VEHNWKDGNDEKGIFDVMKIKRLQMKEGDYAIRVLSAPKMFRFHWVDEVNRSINCGPDCELCLQGEKGQIRYVVNVIDRSDGSVKLWEFGRRVKTSIMNIADKYGDPTGYDLSVIRKGMKAEDTVYTVIPAREEKSLTDDEKKLVTYDLEKIYAITPKHVVDSYLKGIVPDKRSSEKAESKDKEGNKLVESSDDDLPTL